MGYGSHYEDDLDAKGESGKRSSRQREKDVAIESMDYRFV